jgi:hypothetical protein
MRTTITLIGEHPLVLDAAGKLKSRIGTFFVGPRVLVTLPRMTHAMQRLFYRDRLNAERRLQGLIDLTEQETDEIWDDAVDLIMQDRDVLIRPEPVRMPLAFEADECLQEIASKRNIRFLHARNPLVQQAIRARGEYWRISAQPQKDEEIARAIAQSRIAIGGLPLYYYSLTTGTRFLTVQGLASLERLESPDLRQHLIEIRDYSARRNRGHHSELAFFGSDGTFGEHTFAGLDVEGATTQQLRDMLAALAEAFRAAVSPALHADRPDSPVWRNRMFACLTDERDETLSDAVVTGLTPEFFRQIRWFPGGRVEDGELMFDPIFDELQLSPADPELGRLCDPRVKGFIFNYVREFGGLQYVNIGGLMPGLRKRPAVGGHRAYLAEVKHRGSDKPILRILRIQQWGIREHLNEGKDLLTSIMEAQDYTEYTLNRRLGCWQLGMPLPGRIDNHTVPETFYWKIGEQHYTRIWTTYYEREFIEGLATDKIPDALLKDPAFALSVACRLGQAAAPNLIVGRTTTDGDVIFDSGDEMLLMDERGVPRKIVVADHAGTFNDYESPLARFAADYARPVLCRAKRLQNPIAFAAAYLESLSERLTEIQDDYRGKRRAFDTLFQHTSQGEKTFAWRWAKVLARLDQTDMTVLVDQIRDVIGSEVSP